MAWHAWLAALAAWPLIPWRTATAPAAGVLAELVLADVADWALLGAAAGTVEAMAVLWMVLGAAGGVAGAGGGALGAVLGGGVEGKKAGSPVEVVPVPVVVKPVGGLAPWVGPVGAHSRHGGGTQQAWWGHTAGGGTQQVGAHSRHGSQVVRGGGGVPKSAAGRQHTTAPGARAGGARRPGCAQVPSQASLAAPSSQTSLAACSLTWEVEVEDTPGPATATLLTGPAGGQAGGQARGKGVVGPGA